MQYPTYHTTGAAAYIPVPEATPNISFSPIEIPFPGRRIPLQVRVTFPATATTTGKLPIAIFSHGGGPSMHVSSLHGYAPIREFWASHGLVVIQPTHLESKTLGLDVNPSNIKHMYLDARAADVTHIIDELFRPYNAVERAIPALRNRLDTSRIVMAGHSAGGMTTSTLLGAVNHEGAATTNLLDRRVKAGVIFAGTGHKGLSAAGQAIMPFYDLDFSTMRTPALVVYGDEDVQPFLTTRGADWHKDPYTMSPGGKTLLRMKGAKHGLGGIAGWDLDGADDDDVERLWIVMKVSWAWVWNALHGEGEGEWKAVMKAMDGLSSAQIESKE